MADTALYIVAYDITDDRERRQAEHILQGFGCLLYTSRCV